MAQLRDLSSDLLKVAVALMAVELAFVGIFVPTVSSFNLLQSQDTTQIVPQTVVGSAVWFTKISIVLLILVSLATLTYSLKADERLLVFAVPAFVAAIVCTSALFVYLFIVIDSIVKTM